MPGTHGALTKAGRVRKLTPKVEAKKKKGKPPKVRIRRMKRRYDNIWTKKRLR